MFNGLRVFHHRSGVDPAHTAVDDPTSALGAPGEVFHHVPHVWSRHPLEERRIKKRDECFRGLMELEAELVHEVERQV
jgi:hypothetical protein